MAVANDHVSTPAFYLHQRRGLLLEFCIIVSILAIAAQLMVALHNNSKVRKLLRVSSRRARKMPGGKARCELRCFPEDHEQAVHTRGRVGPHSWARFTIG